MTTTGARYGETRWTADTDAYDWHDVQARFDLLADGSVMFSQGVLTARPAAGISGRLYRATDTGQTFYDDGSTWSEVGAREETFTGGTSGVLTVGASEGRLYIPYAGTIQQVLISVGVAPAGGPVTVDVLKNGSTVFPTSGKPTIAAGGYYATAVPDTVAFAANDYFTFNRTAVNGAQSLQLQLRVRRS